MKKSAPKYAFYLFFLITSNFVFFPHLAHPSENGESSVKKILKFLQAVSPMPDSEDDSSAKQVSKILQSVAPPMKINIEEGTQNHLLIQFKNNVSPQEALNILTDADENYDVTLTSGPLTYMAIVAKDKTNNWKKFLKGQQNIERIQNLGSDDIPRTQNPSPMTSEIIKVYLQKKIEKNYRQTYMATCEQYNQSCRSLDQSFTKLKNKFDQKKIAYHPTAEFYEMSLQANCTTSWDQNLKTCISQTIHPSNKLNNLADIYNCVQAKMKDENAYGMNGQIITNMRELIAYKTPSPKKKIETQVINSFDAVVKPENKLRFFSMAFFTFVGLVLSFGIFMYYGKSTYPQDIKYKTFWPRALTPIVDAALLRPVGYFLLFLLTLNMAHLISVPLWILSILLPPIYSIIFHGKYGQTIGKMATRIKVVAFPTEKPISFKQAFLRDAVPLCTSFPLLIYQLISAMEKENGIAQLVLSKPQPGTDPLLWWASIIPTLWFIAEIITMLTNKKRRALHDYIAGTVVIRTNLDNKQTQTKAQNVSDSEKL